VTVNGATSLAIAECAQIGIYKSSTKQVGLIPTIEGNTIKLVPDGALSASASGDMFVWILANSLIIDGDAAKTNDHLKFGAYTLPSGTSFRDNYPEKDSKIESIDKFYLNVGSSTGTFSFEESVPAVLNKYNDATAAWEKVSDLVASEAEGYNYKTVNYTLPEDFEGELALGKYQVSIPEKSFFLETVSATSTSVSYNKAYTAEYELCEMPNVELLPVWDLEEGATYSSLLSLT
jgi:hypothetical protein